MKKTIRIICLVTVIALFSLFALGSGSDKSENKGADEAYTGENTSTDAAVGENKNAGTVVNNDSDKLDYSVGNESVSVTTDSIGTIYVTASFSVTNNGKQNIYLDSGSADVENSNGNLEDTVSLSACPKVLKPGETGWYYERGFYEGSEKTNLKLVAHPEVEKASVDCIRYVVSDVSIKNEQYLGAKVIGRVENTTSEDGTLVNVVANLFDSNGKLIAQESAYVDGTLAAGDKKSFEIGTLNTSLKASNIAKYEVYAYPTQYNW